MKLMMQLACALLFAISASAEVIPEQALKALPDEWFVVENFPSFKITTVAVLPMDNFSLEPGVEKSLYDEVYQRLTGKGYSKISVDHVRSVMKKLGVTTPGQLAGISLKRLGAELHSDAVLMGQIEQSASIHAGMYDAITVSCSLQLVHCETGKTLWRIEQARVAHRQWQLDPLNMFINFVAHENASREQRVAWLVETMMKTLPDGPLSVEIGDLLNQAVEVKSAPSKTK
jgi:hypothetical protein